MAPVRYADRSFVEKGHRFARMMRARGHEVFQHNGMLEVEFEWGGTTPEWVMFNAGVAQAILEDYQQGDVACVLGGRSHELLATMLGPKVPLVEYGIGYEGVLPTTYRVFESHAWRHYVQGRHVDITGRYYDDVIPGFFEPDSFEVGDGSGDYVLYAGRFDARKGPHIACEVAARAGVEIKMVGDGVLEHDGNKWVGKDVTVEGDHIEHLGPVDDDELHRLMGKARCTIMPTEYLEPFGNVAVESMLCGTPVLTPDWGAFVETNANGLSGFRCHSLGEYLDGMWRAFDLDRTKIREYAIAGYSTEAIGPRYDRYFARLETLWGEGWYSL
jgi:glycosyltransferase involved in cell wall biosynthesis